MSAEQHVRVGDENQPAPGTKRERGEQGAGNMASSAAGRESECSIRQRTQHRKQQTHRPQLRTHWSQERRQQLFSAAVHVLVSRHPLHQQPLSFLSLDSSFWPQQSSFWPVILWATRLSFSPFSLQATIWPVRRLPFSSTRPSISPVVRVHVSRCPGPPVLSVQRKQWQPPSGRTQRDWEQRLLTQPTFWADLLLPAMQQRWLRSQIRTQGRCRP